jgi:hypothetical protein
MRLGHRHQSESSSQTWTVRHPPFTTTTLVTLANKLAPEENEDALGLHCLPSLFLLSVTVAYSTPCECRVVLPRHHDR